MSMSAQQSQEPAFGIQRIYLKDLSLEIPNAPQIFLDTQQPAVEIQLDVGAQALVEGIYETSVTVTVTTRAGENVAFLIEAKQAGIFEIRNLPEEQLPLILNVVCANIVYPYLRANVADVVQRAGFPPMHLAEINFEALYQQRLQQQAEAAAPSGIILPGGR
jgi:preprotein translocase subunit SecB